MRVLSEDIPFLDIRSIKASLITVSLLCATVWVLWRLMLASHYVGMVPVELEIVETVAVHEDFTPYSTEGCGVAVFRMSQALKASLASQGITVLEMPPKQETSRDFSIAIRSGRQRPFPRCG